MASAGLGAAVPLCWEDPGDKTHILLFLYTSAWQETASPLPWPPPPLPRLGDSARVWGYF